MNVRSTNRGGRGTRTPADAGDDRTTRARIRDATIALVAHQGTDALTARRVADAADVSPGSIIHHFGSMGGLRAACDKHVAAVIREQKTDGLHPGATLDLLAVLRSTDLTDLAGYLAAVLTEQSPDVDRFVDELVHDAVGYLEQGVATGTVKPTSNPDDRAALLVLWSLGGLVLHRHMRRLLGVDLTDPAAQQPADLARYARAALDAVGTGVLDDALTERLSASLSTAPSPSEEL